MTLVNIQRALAMRLRPRLRRLDLTLDNALAEYRRLAFLHPGVSFVDADGELRPFDEWPAELRDSALHLMSLKRQSLKDVLECYGRLSRAAVP